VHHTFRCVHVRINRGFQNNLFYVVAEHERRAFPPITITDSSERSVEERCDYIAQRAI
jgi:hypothetical protein